MAIPWTKRSPMKTGRRWTKWRPMPMRHWLQHEAHMRHEDYYEISHTCTDTPALPTSCPVCRRGPRRWPRRAWRHRSRPWWPGGPCTPAHTPAPTETECLTISINKSRHLFVWINLLICIYLISIMLCGGNEKSKKKYFIFCPRGEGGGVKECFP